MRSLWLGLFLLISASALGQGLSGNGGSGIAGNIVPSGGGTSVPTAQVLAGQSPGTLKPATAIDSIPIGASTPSTGAFTSLTTSGAFNGAAPNYVVRQDSSATPASGGSGYTQGDILTLQAGCTTNPQIAVGSVTSGAVNTNGYNFTRPGVCPSVPANPISVTGGTGSGAQFNLIWAQLGGFFAVPSGAQSNQGNLFLGSTPQAGYIGTESTMIGTAAGGNILSGNFITAVGLNACGIGGGVILTGVGSAVCIGTDAGRNINQGASSFVIVGTGDCPNLATNKVTCVGHATGAAMVDATQSVLIAGGNTLAHGGSDVIIGDASDVVGASATGGAVTVTVSGGVVGTPTVTAGGSGYVSGSYQLAFSGGGGTGAVGNYTAAGGAVISAAITNGGTGYATAPTVTLPTGTIVGAVAVGQGAKTSSSSVMVGNQAGNINITGTHYTAIGAAVASAVCQTGSQILLIGTNNATDCSSNSESSAIHIGAGSTDWVHVTGTNSPSSSVTSIAGQIVVNGATGGAQGAGTINSAGLFINGTAIGSSGISFGVANSSVAAPVSGGTGYSVGDILVVTDSCTGANGKLGVVTAPGGVIGSYNILFPGICSAIPAGASSIAVTGGTGTGATFNLTYAPLAAGVLNGSLTENNNNLWIGAGTPSGFSGTGTAYSGTGSLFVGNAAGSTIQTGNSILAIGNSACISAGITAAGSMICIGAGAGRNIAQGATNSIIIGVSSGLVLSGVQDLIIGNGVGATFGGGSGDIMIWGGNTLVGGSNDTLVGFGSDVAAASVSSGVAIGQGAKTPGASAVVGALAGNSNMTGTHISVFGPGVAGTTCQTGSQDLLLGTSSSTDCSSTSESSSIHMGAGNSDWLHVTGLGTPTSAIATVSGSLQVGSMTAATLLNGDYGLVKTANSAGAPGAGFVKLEVLAGTVGGTCKIVAFAGTSATPTTVIDNIGGGC